MTDVEKLILNALDKLSEQQRAVADSVIKNTTEIKHLGETVEKLDEVVRTGNGSSLVSVVQTLVQDVADMTTNMAKEKENRAKMEQMRASGKASVSVAFIALVGSAFGSVAAIVVSLLK